MWKGIHVRAMQSVHLFVVCLTFIPLDLLEIDASPLELSWFFQVRFHCCVWRFRPEKVSDHEYQLLCELNLRQKRRKLRVYARSNPLYFLSFRLTTLRSLSLRFTFVSRFCSSPSSSRYFYCSPIVSSQSCFAHSHPQFLCFSACSRTRYVASRFVIGHSNRSG